MQKEISIGQGSKYVTKDQGTLPYFPKSKLEEGDPITPQPRGGASAWENSRVGEREREGERSRPKISRVQSGQKRQAMNFVRGDELAASRTSRYCSASPRGKDSEECGSQ